jgi:hypothetical protein
MADEKRRTIKISFKKKQSKQILWVVIIMVVLLLIVLGVPYVSGNYFNKFVYLKLDFEKTRLGDIRFYSTRIPVANFNGEVTGTFSMNFRNDPRKLEYIDYDVPENKIKFKKDNITYISFNPDMETCEDSALALITFSNFLRDFGQLNISSATTYYDFSRDNNLSYRTCENSPDNTVILLDSGDKTEIKKISDKCYSITYNNCEILPATEKFMLIILEDYMTYFDRD